MSGIILPNGTKTKPKAEKKAEPKEAPEQTQTEVNEAAYEDMSPEEREEFLSAINPEPTGTPVVTAFAIVLTQDGQWSLSPTLDIDIIPERTASVDDVLAGTHVVSSDVSSTASAQKTVSLMMQQTQAMARQAEEARLRASLGNVHR